MAAPARSFGQRLTFYIIARPVWKVRSSRSRQPLRPRFLLSRETAPVIRVREQAGLLRLPVKEFARNSFQGFQSAKIGIVSRA